jgi:hypothetical protein
MSEREYNKKKSEYYSDAEDAEDAEDDDSSASSDASSDDSSDGQLDNEDVFNQFLNGDPGHIIDWILDGKVDKNACDDNHNDSLLIWACIHHIVPLIEFLVEQDCDINHISHSSGRTALDEMKEYPSIYKFLRDHGAKTSEELAEPSEPPLRSEE